MEKLTGRKQIAGVNIYCLLYSLDHFLDAQRGVGVETAKLQEGVSHFYLDAMRYQDCKGAKRKIVRRRLKVKVLTPEDCAYQYRVVTQTPELFEKSYQYSSNIPRATLELGCPIAQISSGWGYWNEDREKAWKRFREMPSRLANKAGEYGIHLITESPRPQEFQLTVTFQDAKRMFDEVNGPNLKILIGTTTINVQGEIIDNWSDMFGEDVWHTHLIDSSPYGHLTWGFGNRSMEEHLEALNHHRYTGYLGQELTEFDYSDNPLSIDRKNVAVYEPSIR